jgi:hypothetical protein
MTSNCALFLLAAERKVKEPNDSYCVWNPCCATRMKTAVAKTSPAQTDDASSIAAMMSPALKQMLPFILHDMIHLVIVS